MRSTTIAVLKKVLLIIHGSFPPSITPLRLRPLGSIKENLQKPFTPFDIKETYGQLPITAPGSFRTSQTVKIRILTGCPVKACLIPRAVHVPENYLPLMFPHG
ncbi:MAG: hypothetical protein ISR62_03815 [Desulfobacteraceae bacterium]|nr:hypothetical protein [Desulfobacterales bacterium]MBL6967530.1 hypothetical protein [Desulfobacteraceae bacterium]